MNCAAILHIYAFDYKSYMQETTQSLWAGFYDCFQYLDLYVDFLFVLVFVNNRIRNVASTPDHINPGETEPLIVLQESHDSGDE
jgi:hypothetical protein